MARNTNGTTAELVDGLVEMVPAVRIQTPEQIAKATKRANRKARQLSRTIEGNISTNVVRVFVGETQALTMSFENNEKLQEFIWMQLLEVNGPAVVNITK